MEMKANTGTDTIQISFMSFQQHLISRFSFQDIQPLLLGKVTLKLGRPFFRHPEMDIY